MTGIVRSFDYIHFHGIIEAGDKKLYLVDSGVILTVQTNAMLSPVSTADVPKTLIGGQRVSFEIIQGESCSDGYQKAYNVEVIEDFQIQQTPQHFQQKPAFQQKWKKYHKNKAGPWKKRDY
jgi:hypothetical protein